MFHIKVFTFILLFYAVKSVVVQSDNSSSLAPKLITKVLTGDYDVTYSIDVDRTVEYIYEFSSDKVSLTQPARITVECDQSNRSFPVLVVVRQQKGVLSWQLPLIVETKSGVFNYSRTSRTLCPDSNYYRPYHTSLSSERQSVNEEVIVSVSTSSPKQLKVNLNVTLVPGFFIDVGKTYNVSVTPGEPRYYGFAFTENVSRTVLLRVDSTDEICMTISIQNMSCPVFDLERNVQFEGYWQTMNLRGGITLTREAFPNGFYVVFVAKGDDTDCSGTFQTVSRERRKHATFSLASGISVDDYLIATFGALIAFAMFYVFAVLVSVAHCIRDRRGVYLQPAPTFETFDGLPPPQTSTPTPSTPGAAPGRSSGSPAPSVCSVLSDTIDSSLDETDVDMLRDAEHEKDVFRTKRSLSIRDLARKHPRILQKKSQLYLWNLLTVGMFYALPVVQLVFTYQNVMQETGNHDLCYFNFLCSHPFAFLSDFNHVFSNLGYVLLGLLFVGLTYRRDVMHRSNADPNLDKYYGIPQHYGLFYAMGAGLMMEGIMSACYHVCPNHSNFQFDTSFMYVMAMVSMVKIYQTRHPDINASAYATYGALAAVIFIGMWGVLANSKAFWIVFTVVHLLACFMLTAQIYYMGRWKLDCGMFRRVFCGCYHELRASPLMFFKPAYPNRMVLLLLGNLFNWVLAAYGLTYQLDDFATHLLIIFMANLLLYYNFYIVMKVLSGEKILTQPLVYILMSYVAWAGSMHFFLNKSISWALTPAGSKVYNKPCAVLDFYDNHDIWHFLSAASMFFSFMVLLTLDDDLRLVHRSKIPVF